MTLSVAEAQARLPDLIAGLRPGDALTLTQDDRPVIRLTAGPVPADEIGTQPIYVTREGLDRIDALRPQTPCPVNDNDLKEARAGGMYGLTD